MLLRSGAMLCSLDKAIACGGMVLSSFRKMSVIALNFEHFFKKRETAY